MRLRNVTDFLIQATLSNLLVSTILAVIAWVVQRRFRSASLANLLWAIVLIKMVTPPLFSLPVVEVPRVSRSSVQPTGLSSELPLTYTTDPNSGAADLTLPTRTESPTSHTASQTTSVSFWSRSSGLAIFAWIAVSAMLFFVSAFRIVRFHWLLKVNSRVQLELASGLCNEVARQFGIRRCPDVVVSSANIAPFVWWMAGRSIIVVSEQTLRQLNVCDLRLVITHEMAHIKRRDHWFRWLEWFALVGLWWNPVMWWARAQLRISEEMACDDLVLETTHSDVHQYANALLTMAELLTSSAIRPPVVASAINSGGHLEKRLKMMIEQRNWKVPATLRLGILAMAVSIFPLGLVYAQDSKAIERRLGGAVEAGELTLEQARVMMEALKRSAGSERGRDREMEAKKRRYMAFAQEIEAAVDAGKVSKEDAEKKLIGLRKEMFSDAGRKKKFGATKTKIEAAVDAGKVSKEDAEKKLIQHRKDMEMENTALKAKIHELEEEIMRLKEDHEQ
jgi:bla regulator protein BlaR1